MIANAVKLLNWGIKSNPRGFDLTGCVIGHDRLPDGTRLTRTSGVQDFSVDYESREVLIQTNNTLYSGSFDDYNPEYLEKGSDYWEAESNVPLTQKETNAVFADLINQLTNTQCRLYKSINHDPEKPEVAERTTVSETEQAKSARIEAAKSKLEERDVYLEVGCGYRYYFSFAVLGTGEVVTEPCVHTATFGSNSVLVFNHYTRPDCLDLRYFPHYNGIEFYNDLYNTENRNLHGKLIIYNSGKKSLDVIFTNGETIALAPNEERVCN